MRVMVANLKAALGIDQVSLATLPKVLASSPSLSPVARQLKGMPAPVT
jgi:hypothetical protein